MAGYLGASPVPQTIQKKQSFTATASQTTFTTTGYTDGAFINVYLNGVRLINGTDYTATNGSDIVLTTGASASDVLDFETFNEFTLVDQTLETPTFRTSATLKNDTEEDTDGGRESTLIFKGEQSGGEISTLAEIEASHDGTADDEKGDLIFRTNDGSDGTSPTERLKIDSSGVVNVGTASGTQPSYFNSFLNVQNNASTSDHASITITSGTGGFAGLHFGDSANGRIGQVAYNNADDVLIFTANNSERVRVQSGGGISFNGDTAAANALNDAEEGTFTPVFGYSGGNGTGSWGYSAQYGFYQKIGNMVWYSLDLRFTSFSKGSASGTPQITGLPYNAENNSGFARWGASQVALYQWPYPSTDGYHNLASMLNGSTALQLSYQRPNLSSVDQVDPDGDSMAFITGFYKV